MELGGVNVSIVAICCAEAWHFLYLLKLVSSHLGMMTSTDHTCGMARRARARARECDLLMLQSRQETFKADPTSAKACGS